MITTYECFIADSKTERYIEDPRTYLTFEEVAVLVGRHYGPVTTRVLIRNIQKFSDQRTKEFTYRQANKTLVIAYHYHPVEEVA